PELSAADDALLGRLRELRTAIARDEKVPAYVVFADRTLLEMAVRRPRNLRAMEAIRGVGPVKLERYGERMLNLLRTAHEPETA
ncbi:MAG TPA: HRDC domain-containing protein, partial [Gemmatimonadaceae bacterium]